MVVVFVVVCGRGVFASMLVEEEEEVARVSVLRIVRCWQKETKSKAACA